MNNLRLILTLIFFFSAVSLPLNAQRAVKPPAIISEEPVSAIESSLLQKLAPEFRLSVGPALFMGYLAKVYSFGYNLNMEADMHIPLPGALSLPVDIRGGVATGIISGSKDLNVPGFGATQSSLLIIPIELQIIVVYPLMSGRLSPLGGFAFGGSLSSITSSGAFSESKSSFDGMITFKAGAYYAPISTLTKLSFGGFMGYNIVIEKVSGQYLNFNLGASYKL